jgi:hypothetical protein
MQRLQRFLYILVYGSFVGTLFSILGWIALMSVLWSGNALITFIPHLNVQALSIIIRARLYGGFLGFMLGVIPSLGTGIIIGLVAATLTSLFAFPLKNPVLYKRLMHVVCTVFAIVGTLLIVPGEYDIRLQIMVISMAALTALVLSQHVAAWTIAQSLTSP